MPPSPTVHGGQHDNKYVTFEWVLHAAFTADTADWALKLEPARIDLRSYLQLDLN